MADVTGAPVPTGSSEFDVPGDMQALADHFGTLPSVANVAALPATGNWKGKLRLVESNSAVYVNLDGANSWKKVAGTGGAVGTRRRTASSIPIPNGSYGDISSATYWQGGQLLRGMTYSGGFIVPEAGFYQLNWSLLGSNTVPFIAGIVRNPSGTITGDLLHAVNNSVNNGAVIASGSALVQAAANDKFVLYAFGVGGSQSVTAQGEGIEWSVSYAASL